MGNDIKNDVEYMVFADKGIVVCKIWNCTWIAADRIEKYVKVNVTTNKYCIDDCYVGVAKCAPEDKFDEEFGKKLALTKAKAKRCRAINNAIWEYLDTERKYLNELERNGLHNVPDVNELFEEE